MKYPGRFILTVPIVTLTLALTMRAHTSVDALTNSDSFETDAVEQGPEGNKKEVKIVRRVKQATASASIIRKIRSSEIANAMVTVQGRTVRPRNGVSMYSLSNLGVLVIKGGDTTTPKAVEGDLYLNPDGSWTFKGCLCVNKLGQGDDCTISNASTKTCNTEETCCGWAEITLGP